MGEFRVALGSLLTCSSSHSHRGYSAAWLVTQTHLSHWGLPPPSIGCGWLREGCFPCLYLEVLGPVAQAPGLLQMARWQCPLHPQLLAVRKHFSFSSNLGRTSSLSWGSWHRSSSAVSPEQHLVLNQPRDLSSQVTHVLCV